MKTSIKLLLGLALCLVIAMFGAAISLRSQYDKLDKSDKYARWQKKPLPAFQAVQITGPSSVLVQIEPGATTRLLADSLGQWTKPPYTYKVERDTLYIQLNAADGEELDIKDEDDKWHRSEIVVQLPSLVAVSTSGARCQIRDFRGDVLSMQQGGKGGNTSLQNLTYNQLNASLSGHNQLTLYGTSNNINKAAITARDSSRLFQYTDFKQSLTLTADPTAKIRLTGKAVQQIQQ
ncbi:MAG TPA: hypothetical protein VGA96_16995 [Fibrella sp.]